MAATPAVKERLRKMRQKYHLGEYKKGGSNATRKHTKKRGGQMFRKKAHRKRGNFGGGIMGMLKPVLIGTAGGLIVGVAEKSVPQISSIPFNKAVGGAGLCFVMGQKAPMKLIVGGASGQFVAPIVNNATGNRIY